MWNNLPFGLHGDWLEVHGCILGELTGNAYEKFSWRGAI